MATYLDGNYTAAQIAEPPDYEIPFANDPKPYINKVKYWQLLASYSDISLGEAGPFGGGYIGLSPGSFKTIGAGLVEFQRMFATVPDTRSEYESHVYGYRFVFSGPSYCIDTSPLNVHSRIQFDYFQTNDPDSISLPRAPQLLQTCIGLALLGDFPTESTPTGTEVQAEDATFTQWKPGIYERKIRFIQWISSADLIGV